MQHTETQRNKLVVLVQVTQFAHKFQKRYLPHALLYLGGALRDAGFTVKAYHGTTQEEVDDIVREVSGLDPLLVGVSVFIGGSANESAKFSKRIREANPDVPIVWGGIHASAVPQQCLYEPYVDMVGIGEGEETVVEIAKAMATGESFDRIKGIAFRKNGNITITEPRPFIKDLDQYKPDYSLVDFKKYIQNVSGGKKILSDGFITTRGCPYNCKFCYNNRFNQRRWRTHSLGFVASQLTELKKLSGVTGLTLADDNFWIDRKRCIAILEIMKELGIECAMLRATIKDVTPELVQKLSELGIGVISFGTESLNDRLLKLMEKPQTKEQVLRGLKVLAQSPQISVSTNMIIGFPTETREEFMNDIRDGLSLYDIHPHLNVFWAVYNPFPGTEFYDLAIRCGFKPPERIADWADIDRFYVMNKMKQWLSWVTKNDIADTKMFMKYLDSGILNLSRTDWISNKSLVLQKLEMLFRRFFFNIARYRISHLQFFLPVDLYLYLFSWKAAVKLAQVLRLRN